MSRTPNLLGALAQVVNDAQLSAIAGKTGLGPSAAAALVTLNHAPGESIDFLRRTLDRSHSSVVRMVDGLVARGLARKAPAEDGRRVALLITSRGQRLVSAVLGARDSALALALDKLAPGERATLDALLAKLLASQIANDMDAYRTCRLCDGDLCEPCPVEAAALDNASGD